MTFSPSLGDNGPGFDRQSVAAVGDIPALTTWSALQLRCRRHPFDRGERRNVGPLHGVAGDGVGLPVPVNKRNPSAIAASRSSTIGRSSYSTTIAPTAACAGVPRRRQPQFTLETDEVLCEQPPVGRPGCRSRRHVGGQHGEDTRHRRCRTGVELRDAGVRDARAAELGHQLAGQIEVGGVATPRSPCRDRRHNETRYLGNGHLPPKTDEVWSLSHATRRFVCTRRARSARA